MQAVIVGLLWIMALGLAIYLIIRARPGRITDRYRTQIMIKSVEPLSEDDVLRTVPYEVTALVPSTDPRYAGKNVFYQVTLTPQYLPVGHVRQAARLNQPMEAWVSMADPHDVVFQRPGNWRADLVLQAVLVMVAQFVMTGICLLKLNFILESDAWLVTIFALSMASLAYVGALAISKSVRLLIVLIRLSSKPVTVPARITGVRQILGLSYGHPSGYEVSLMWAEIGMPTQFSVVKINSSRRRSQILLRKLIAAQLAEESRGYFRVREEEAPETAHSAVSELQTPQGPTIVKITSLPLSDPRSDPRPQKVRLAAEKARAKREAQLQAQRRAFEKSTAKARIEAAKRVEVGDSDNALELLAQDGPMAWYYPLNPGRVNLVGLGETSADLLALFGRLLVWLGVALLSGLGIAQLGVLHPEVMFPAHVSPSGLQMPLGQWK